MALKPISLYNPFPKLLVFIGLVLIHIFSFTLAGMLVGGSIWGSEYVNNPSIMNDLTNPSTITYLKFIQVFAQVGMLMGSLLFIFLAYGQIASYIGADKSPQFKSILLVTAIIFLALPVMNYLSLINEQIHLPASWKTIELWFQLQEKNNNILIEAFLKVDGISGLVINILMIALFTAIVEEIAFRGVLQNTLYSLFKNKHIAIIVTALSFACIHFQFYKLIPMVLIALLLGYIYDWSKSIWLSITLHFINNATTVIVVYFYNKGLVSDIFDVFGKRPQDTLAVITSTIIISLTAFVIYKIEKRNVIPTIEDHSF